MRRNVLLVDPLMEVGHLNFNRMLYDLAVKDNDVSFMSGAKYLEKIGVRNRVHFDEMSGGIASTLSVRVIVLFFLWQVARQQRRVNYDLVVFTSYDVPSFILASPLFRGQRYAVINHNNLDFRGSYLRNSLFRLLPSRFTHVCFESYIKNHVSKVLGKNAVLLHHPVRFDRVGRSRTAGLEPGQFKVTVFAPSGGNSKRIVDEFLRDKPWDWRVVAKRTNPDQVSGADVSYHDWVENYYEMLDQSDYVLVAREYEYRVSGVVYEAMAMRKRVIMPKCALSVALKAQYPSAISFLCEQELFQIEVRPTKLSDYKKFRMVHSAETIRKQLANLVAQADRKKCAIATT